jgi:RNA 2',3'-cyclic 3'-phosphodiesterase
MKRTFIAVKVEAGKELLLMFSALKSEMNSDLVKWTGTNQIHVTIAFLGDTPDDKIIKVSSMLEDVCSETGGFAFSVSGIGVFKSLNDPRVIRAGVERSDEFENLFTSIKTQLERLGLPVEIRAFKPHLTLGRVKLIRNRNILEQLILRYDKKVFQQVKVTEVIYYESILRQTGPTYIPIKICKLK